MTSEARPRRGDRGRARHADVILLPLVGVGLVAAVGAAVLTTSSPTRARVSIGVVASPAAGGNAGVSPEDRIAIARGANDGYRAVLQGTRTGSDATTLDVSLTTEGEPASAPTAHVDVTGRDGVRHRIELSIVDAGHWVSGRFPLPAGKYTAVATFDRKGGSVVIRTTIQLT